MDPTPLPAGLLEQSRAWDALRRPVWMFDPHALCGVYANPPALKLWGAQSLEELLARDFSRLSPAARARTARMAQATANGEEIAERWTFFPNGQPVTVQATISTYPMEDGRAVLLFEASPLEVQAEERRAVEALRHTSALITLFEEDGEAVFSNPAAFAARGLEASSFASRFRDPNEGRRMLGLALAGETVSEVCEMSGEGGERWHHLDVRGVLDPVTGAAGVLLSEFDVTRRVQAEQARAAAEQKAAMAQARERFLADMSHDLRTPLNAVIGFSGLLKDAGLPGVQADQAGRIHDSGKRLLHVVNEMIRLSELDGWTGAPIPAEPAAPAATPAVAEPEPCHDLEPAALRVLYVDDNAHNRALVTALLGVQGVECQTAEDGRQGWEAACAQVWDVILMDIQMPVMDGVEAARAIRASASPACSTPIIAVTANTLSSQVETYLAAGMDDCMAKPINVAELFGKLAYWSDPGRGEADCAFG